MSDWKYVEKDGNPDKAGVYPVILLYPESEFSEEENQPRVIEGGRVFATVDARYFGDAEACDDWRRRSQPSEGLVWTEQTGSYFAEEVYAWLPVEVSDIKLPENVEWDL